MIIAILELSFRPHDLDKSMGALHEVLHGTRAFPGSEGVEVLVDVADPTRVHVVERWATLPDDEAYRAWRAGDGKTDLGTWLAAPPTLTKFHLAEGV
jgi:quinol monooxygenase YgiN